MSNPQEREPMHGKVWGSRESPESLRDRFAMAALAGHFANKLGLDYSWDETAADCYRVADAMMAQRSKAPAVSE